LLRLVFDTAALRGQCQDAPVFISPLQNRRAASLKGDVLLPIFTVFFIMTNAEPAGFHGNDGHRSPSRFVPGGRGGSQETFAN
jgi:hypothetical protein